MSLLSLHAMFFLPLLAQSTSGASIVEEMKAPIVDKKGAAVTDIGNIIVTASGRVLVAIPSEQRILTVDWNGVVLESFGRLSGHFKTGHQSTPQNRPPRAYDRDR